VEQLLSLLPLLAIVLLFWLLVIRPAQKRQKATARLQSSLEVGQRVMLTSGVFGTVSSIEDDRLRIVVAEGVELEVVRAAVAGVDDRAGETDPNADAAAETNSATEA
jgi:preprotein translocase subunit YajC